MANCRLCGTEAPLRSSHIVPAFVFRWLKESSATGYIRPAFKPNRRVQDGFVYRMLCQKCEQLLGKWEKEFRDQLFNPVTSGPVAPAGYGSWLCMFAASVCWRVLVFYHENGWIRNIPESRSAVVPKALERWSQNIRSASIGLDCRDFHFIPSGTLQEVRGLGPPPNINRYLSRYVQIDVATGRDQVFVYAKLGPAMLLGFLEHPTELQWPDTAIDPRGGIFPRKLEVPGSFAEYLFDHARRVLRSQELISVRQSGLIGKAYRANIDRTAASGTFESLAADVEMFGREVVFCDDSKPAPESDTGNG